jgi:quinol monooxygenase YgiN
MTVFIAKLIVAEGREGDFERLQTELSELTQANEPDTIVYDVLRASDKTGEYVVYARFKDQAAFDLHQGTDFHTRLVPPILDCLGDAEMELTFYDFIA